MDKSDLAWRYRLRLLFCGQRSEGTRRAGQKIFRDPFSRNIPLLATCFFVKSILLPIYVETSSQATKPAIQRRKTSDLVEVSSIPLIGPRIRVVRQVAEITEA